MNSPKFKRFTQQITSHMVCMLHSVPKWCIWWKQGSEAITSRKRRISDHLDECDSDKKGYISCLQTSGYQSERCRNFSKKYLECRMERNLMARQDLSELGFYKEVNSDASSESNVKFGNGHPTPQGGKSVAN